MGEVTPEEKAVIDAAVNLRDVHRVNASVMSGVMASTLIDAVDALIFACPQCNAGGHTCPGDGNPIGHTATDCGRHGRDGAESAILAGELDGSTFPCWECLTDPTEDPRPWCDCRPEDFGTQHPGHPCRLRAHAPSKCLNRLADASPECDNCASLVASVTRVDGTEGGELARDCEHGPAWIATTMENCLINDRIRLGTEEATVLRSNRGIWNVGTIREGYKDGAGNWHPAYVAGASPWFPADRHVELRLELDGPTAPSGFNPYPPDLAVEILCTPERLAVLRIQEGFPGSAPTSSHVN